MIYFIVKGREPYMLLAIDIGNTNVSLGGFEDDAAVFTARISTNPYLTEDEYAYKLLDMLALYGVPREAVTGAIVSSVVPPVGAVVKRAARVAFGIEPLNVGPGIRTGLNIHCDNPVSVGADMICACVAVNRLYGAPALIIDMGTATKIMLVDDRGAFVGASIIPGVSMGLQALADGTAQLPQVSLDAPFSVIGKNTADCMKSGVVFGNAALLDGMIDRFAEAYGKELPVYATGGAAPTVVGYCKKSITLDEQLVLKGLQIIYRKNR